MAGGGIVNGFIERDVLFCQRDVLDGQRHLIGICVKVDFVFISAVDLPVPPGPPIAMVIAPGTEENISLISKQRMSSGGCRRREDDLFVTCVLYLCIDLSMYFGHNY